LEAYNNVRNAGGGTGEGNGAWVSIHDGFLPRNQWAGVFPNADRMALDSHPYICFGGQSDSPMSSYRDIPCTTWGSIVNTSMAAFGLTTAGEFSNAVTDCGLWLNGVGLGSRYEGTYPGNPPPVGNCTPWTDWTNWDDNMKADIKNFALSSMDALQVIQVAFKSAGVLQSDPPSQNYFFWTWKIGNSTASGKVESPAWSYQLGLEQGWMPTDPREAADACGNTSPWEPPLQAWQTGGAGAGDIPATVTGANPWPPVSISAAGAVTLLPSYTPATPTINAGNGWNNPSDNAGLGVDIPGCTYLDPWVDPSTPPPPVCSGGGGGAASPSITPPPT
jgi:glucan 1,3-beta-glucosidase